MYAVAVFSPLLGAIIAGILAFTVPADKQSRTHINHVAQWATCSAMALSAVEGGLSVEICVFDRDGGLVGRAEGDSGG